MVFIFKNTIMTCKCYNHFPKEPHVCLKIRNIKSSYVSIFENKNKMIQFYGLNNLLKSLSFILALAPIKSYLNQIYLDSSDIIKS